MADCRHSDGCMLYQMNVQDIESVQDKTAAMMIDARVRGLKNVSPELLKRLKAATLDLMDEVKNLVPPPPSSEPAAALKPILRAYRGQLI